MLYIDKCPDISVRVIWDGGAEGTSISDKALSRVMRAQKKAGTPWAECSLHSMALMVPAQKFYSYKDGHDSDGGQVVDILSSLCLVLPIRMVPGSG